MRISTKELLAQHWLLLLTGFMLVFFSGFGQTVFIGAHIPFIEETFDLSHTQLSLYYSIATLCSGLLIFFTGKLLDHMALQRFVPIVLLGLACGAFLMAFTPTPLLLFPAFFLLRQCGQGLMGLTNTVSMNRYLEKARGRAMAITGFGGPMTILYPILALFMIRLFGWQQAWMYYGIFILCILMPVFFLLFRHHDRTIHSAWKESMAQNDASEDANPIRQWTRLEVMKDWRFYVLACVLIIEPCFNTSLFYYQGELAASKGLPPEAIVVTFPLFTIASVCTMYTAGHILDRFGEKYVLITYPLLYISGLMVLLLADGLPALYGGMIFLGTAMGTMNVLGGPLLAKLYGTKNLGSIKSALSSIFVISTSIGPLLVGFGLDHGVTMADVLIGFSFYAFLSLSIMTFFMRNQLD